MPITNIAIGIFNPIKYCLEENVTLISYISLNVQVVNKLLHH